MMTKTSLTGANMTTQFVRQVLLTLRFDWELYLNNNPILDNVLYLDSEFDFYIQDTGDTYYQFRNNLIGLYGLPYSNHVNSIQVYQ
jgi:hypothetical protein